MSSKRFSNWIFYPVVALVALVFVYAVARFIHIAIGSIYQGDRGAYLQLPTPTAITIRWQTSESGRGLVKYGLAPNELTNIKEADETSDSHEVRLEGLKPATRYYYAYGTKDGVMTSNSEHWFITAPEPESRQSTRFWVIGDAGRAVPKQAAVRDAMLSWVKQNPRKQQAYLDFMLTTGDNAYESGRNEEYQTGFFLPYKNILKNIPVWPAYGNHDARRWAYFDLFSLPEDAESGGVASDTENYYSFDYANVHVIVLDSQVSSRSADGEMAVWLRKDLAQTNKDWIIAVMHHPPYSKGSHDSDNESDSRGRLFDVRENLLPILEKGGVDLVFTGHSHVYERSYLIGCHYGTSDELKDSMLFDNSTNGPYLKSNTKPKPYQGTVYAVVGSSSRADHGQLNHPVMAASKRETGSLIVDIEDLSLKAYFINDMAQVTDTFKIEKGVETIQTRPENCQ
ncbi:MAG: metallophosphoesterase family protein [Gammaproteobacteria bacterium]|nr:metallophosphoesterase family protein [Gammaproteobacteria bacterium]MDH5778218.1 metallophosphoesterase family protein [Gammaproteobacteria bacterium]